MIRDLTESVSPKIGCMAGFSEAKTLDELLCILGANTVLLASLWGRLDGAGLSARGVGVPFSFVMRPFSTTNLEERE